MRCVIAQPRQRTKRCNCSSLTFFFDDRGVKLDSLSPIYLSYSNNHNRVYLDQWVKSSIRRGYVDLCGTQIRLIIPIFEYCLDCSKKSYTQFFGNTTLEIFSFYLFSFFRTGTRQHLCHTYIASLFSPVTLARRRITNTRMLPHGPSSYHSYLEVAFPRPGPLISFSEMVDY